MTGEIGHTPGPWKAIKGVQGDDLRCAVVVPLDRDYLLATVENGAPGDFCDTEWANARLLAAAPDLLEAAVKAEMALSAASRMLTEDCRTALNGKDWGGRELSALRTAIARATSRVSE